jgi:amidase
MSDELTLPARTLRDKLVKRQLSSVELLAASLARIDRFNPGLNALVAVDRAAAKQAAEAADARLAAGLGRPLEGLPVTIKDAFDVAAMASCAGAPPQKDRRPAQDAAAVARLRQAGAVILGKSNVPVYCGDFQTYNPLYGTTNHPWNPDLTPGGSSGGAAAAVATGMSTVELGSDLGGSIRWPAHACGLFGLKTSWGLVSTYGHMPPPPHKRFERNTEMLVAGPLARSAGDLDLMLELIAGPRDFQQSAAPLRPPRHLAPAGLRVVVWRDDPFAPVEPCVAAAVELAAQRLAAAGARVDDKARPAVSFAETYEIFGVLNHAIVAFGLPSKLRDRLASHAASFRRGDLSPQAMQARAARLSPGDYYDLNRRRQTLQRKWADFFTRHDVVLCPAAPRGAFAHDHSPDILKRTLAFEGRTIPYLDIMKWAAHASAADLPAAVAPMMLGRDGLPRGVQIIAAGLEDKTATAVAAMLETLGSSFLAPPSLG